MSEKNTKTAKEESTEKDAGDAGDSSSDASAHARELVAFGFEALSPGMRSSSVSRDVIDSGKVVDNVASWLSDGWGPIRRRVEVEIEVDNSSDEDTGVSDSLEDTVAIPITETAVEQHVVSADNAETTETAAETVETVAATVVEEPVIAHVIEKTVVVATTRIRIKVMMMESNAVSNYGDTELTREVLRLWGELSATERTKMLAALGLMKRDEVDAELRRMMDEAVGDINVLRGRLRDVEKKLAAYQSINAGTGADENSDSDSEDNNSGDGDGGPQKELSGPEVPETPKTDADGSQGSQVQPQPEAKIQKVAENSAEKARRRRERRRTEAQANDVDESASEESGDSTTGSNSSNSSTGSGGAGVSKTLSPEEQAELMAEMNADNGAGSDVDEIKAAAAAEAASAPRADDQEAEM